MATFPESLVNNFQALTLGQRLGVVVVLALAIATIPLLMIMGKEPELVVLFSHLDSDDTRAVIQELGKQGVIYELAEDGNTIHVPAERVHELRLQLASLGLPESAGVGFEIFDRTGLGVTPFTQQMNYRSRVNEMQHEAGRLEDAVVKGENVSIHQAVIAGEKAGLSFKLLMQVRNKMIEAYQEVIRMQV